MFNLQCLSMHLFYIRLLTPSHINLFLFIFHYLFLLVYFPLWSSRLVRSRYSVLVCLFAALVLISVNTHFLFFSSTKRSPNQLLPIEAQDLLESDAQIYVVKSVSDGILIQLENQTIDSNLNVIPKHLSLPFQSTKTPSLSPMKYLQMGSSEISGCELLLAGSQWATWNLVDLCLSSAGPFLFILILNILIVLNVYRQKRQGLRPAPVFSQSSRNATKAAITATSTRLDVGSRSNCRNTVTFSLSNSKSNRIRKSKAELSVTLMLLFTTLAFLLLRTPISFGHIIQMLVSEEKLFTFIEPVTFMAAFALAEILAFGQHASQFYIYFACSARFRQALRREFRLIFQHVVGLARRFRHRDRHSTQSQDESQAPAAEASALVPVREPTLSAQRPQNCIQSLTNKNLNECRHEFEWASRHLLICRICFSHRLVHHPSCVHYRDDNRLNCECLSPSLERPAHIVIHLRDHFTPIFGMTYRS